MHQRIDFKRIHSFFFLSVVLFFAAPVIAAGSKSAIDHKNTASVVNFEKKSDTSQFHGPPAKLKTVWINDHLFIIPAWHLARQDKPGHHIQLVADGSDLRLKRNEDEAPHPSHDRIEIKLQGNHRFVREIQFDTRRWLDKHLKFQPRKYNEKLGLWEYRRHDPKDEQRRGWYYLSDDQHTPVWNQHPLVIQCDTLSLSGLIERGRIRCQAEFLFRLDIHLTFSFPVARIAQWRDIGERVRAFVENFVVTDGTPLPFGAQQISTEQGAYTKTGSAESQTVLIKDHVLSIPGNYIAWNPASDTFVSLHAQWPGLAPYDNQSPKETDQQAPSIKIYVENDKAPLQLYIHSRLKKDPTILPRRWRDDLGLWEYRRHNAELDAALGWYYLSAEKPANESINKSLTSIYCGAGEKIKRGYRNIQCEATFLMKENLFIRYYFFHQHMSDWRKIEADIRALVNNFVLEGEEARQKKQALLAERKRYRRKQSGSWSPELMEVAIHDNRLSIPRWYISQGPRDGKFVSIMFYWPSMDPLRKQKDEPHQTIDRILVHLNGDAKYQIQRRTPSQQDRLDTSPHFLPKTFLKELGLWVYRKRDPRLRNMSWYYLAEDMPISLAGTSRIISCSSVKRDQINPDTVDCRVSYFLKENLQLIYRFYHKHISDWRKIDASIRTLIDSFALEDEEAKQKQQMPLSESREHQLQQSGPFSAELMEVRVGEYQLLIPRWYVGWNPSHEKFVSLYAYWPGLEAYRKFPEEKKFLMEQIKINLDSRTLSRNRDIHAWLQKKNINLA